jgi:hypothetical protein
MSENAEVRLSTVRGIMEDQGNPVFHCPTWGCEVHTFIAFVEPNERAFCPSCSRAAWKVVA